MGKTKNFRKQAAALGQAELPRFQIPPDEELKEKFGSYMSWDLAKLPDAFTQLQAMKPTRRALLSLLSEKSSVKDIRLIRDKFIPKPMQHEYCAAIDSEQLGLSEMLLNASKPVPEAWPHSLKVAYLCLQDGFSNGDVLGLWVEQIQKGRTEEEKRHIIFNMAKALSMSESPVDE